MLAIHWLVIINFLHSQSVSKLTESIKNYDYYHTKVYAHKMLRNKKKLSAAAYALAYVYYQNYQPFHNIDSADKYIHLAVLNYPHQPYLSKYGNIDSNAIYSLYDSIVHQQFQKINSTDFPKIYDVFISQHPFMSKDLKEKIRLHQYQKVIQYVQRINKSDTTFHYIAAYESHPQMNVLKQILDNQIFDELTTHRTAAEYLLFLKNYPKNINRDKALQLLLDIYIKEKNTAGLKSFVNEFASDEFYAEQAWKWLFAYSVKKFNNEELERFMQEYPKFPFKKDILEEMEMNAQILIPYADTSESIGFIDTSGIFIIPPIYDAVTPFRENISVVFKNDSAFFINKKHKQIIAQAYKDAAPFYNGYAPVFDGKYWYFINRLGVRQSDYFDWISELSYDNNYVFKKQNLYGLCDYKGQIILPAQFEKLGDFENHLSYYTENNLYGIVWDNGKKYPAQYQWISSFNNGIAIVKKNNLYGIVNANDENILNPEYDLIFHCNKDIYMVIKNKKYGFFNATEKCFTYFIQYDFNKNADIKTFSNGQYFKLIVQNKVFVGTNNSILLSKSFYRDAVITKDFIFVKNNKSKWKRIYPASSANINFEYDDFVLCENKTFIGKIKDIYVIADHEGNVKHQTSNQLEYVYKNYYYEETEESGQLIDAEGKVILKNIKTYKVFIPTEASGFPPYLIVETNDGKIKVMK
ncbi:MAG: hypothetical protein Fur0023_10850 [Bacteroidia bacterium]